MDDGYWMDYGNGWPPPPEAFRPRSRPSRPRRLLRALRLHGAPIMGCAICLWWSLRELLIVLLS
ncbi:hypothetical protein GCM10029978_060380 [Actinoallomurus acanthiterrae]